MRDAYWDWVDDHIVQMSPLPGMPTAREKHLTAKQRLERKIEALRKTDDPPRRTKAKVKADDIEPAHKKQRKNPPVKHKASAQAIAMSRSTSGVSQATSSTTHQSTSSLGKRKAPPHHELRDDDDGNDNDDDGNNHDDGEDDEEDQGDGSDESGSEYIKPRRLQARKPLTKASTPYRRDAQRASQVVVEIPTRLKVTEKQCFYSVADTALFQPEPELKPQPKKTPPVPYFIIVEPSNWKPVEIDWNEGGMRWLPSVR